MASKVTASITTARPRLGVVIVDPVVESGSVVPVVTAQLTQPIVTTGYVSAVATTSYVIPAPNISYISMIFSADIDVSGLFSCKIDSVTLTDGKIISFAKSQSELFVVSDGIAKLLSRPVADSISLSDITTRTLIFLRSFADTQSISDASDILFAKVAAHSVLMSDAFASVFSKSASDSVVVAELSAKTVAKYLADTFSISDSTYLATDKLFADSQSLADQVILGVDKLLSESLIPADAVAFDITKSIADGFAMNDSADATDGLTFTFSISVSNVIFVSDAEQKSFETARTDSVGAGDAGTLTNQNYIDPTYFAEDYVGASYTF